MSFYFCNIDFGKKLSGVERSSMKRSILFNKYLNIDPIFLSTNLNLEIVENWEHYKKINWISDYTCHFNLYYEFLDLKRGEDYKKSLFCIGDDILVRVNELHDRVYDSNRKMKMYIVWRDQERTIINYINYFFNGRKIKRDKFNLFGQICISQTLNENQEILFEDLLKPDGRLKIRRIYENNKIKEIHIFNDTGVLSRIFKDESDLIYYWLTKIAKENDFFIIDKNRVWSKPLSMLKRNLDIKVISVLHSVHVRDSSNISSSSLNSNYSRILKEEDVVDACICLTLSQKADIYNRFLNSKYRLYNICHPNDISIHKVDFSTRDKNKIVTLARLSSEKQLNHMIMAMKKVVEIFPEKKLFIYGEGKERDYLSELILENELQENVFLSGYVEDIHEILKSSILYLSTSKVEGFPLSFIESLSQGVAIISYDIKYGPNELIKNGINGYLVENGNIELMAEKIIEFFNKKDEDMLFFSKNSYDLVGEINMKNIAEKWKIMLKDYGVKYE